MPVKRNIVTIDEKKCNGCGLCVPKCAEGALQIIDGKAKLVSEVYCDGLGACLGECPQDAIKIEERAAEAFDEHATNQYLKKIGRKPLHADEKPVESASGFVCPGAAARAFDLSASNPGRSAASGFACPGSSAQTLEAPSDSDVNEAPSGQAQKSQLKNWPVQLKLAPVKAPYFQGAKLLIAADCAPFAYPDFHRRLLAGRTLMICCPKLDDVSFYREKLTEIFRENDIESVEVAHMEVPCCFGLKRLVEIAIADSGRELPFGYIVLGIRGNLIERVEPR